MVLFLINQKKNFFLYQVNEKHGYFSIFKDVRFADNKSPKKINVKSYI